MDPKDIAVKELKRALKLFTLDLQALPEEAFARSLGGNARTVADIVFEVNLVNDHVGTVLRGEKPFDWPEGDWIYAPENLRTKEQVLAGLNSSAEKIIATVEGFTTEQMEETIETEDGPTTRFERCRFMVVHLWYHNGQLNYIQTLLGDSNWHWK